MPATVNGVREEIARDLTRCTLLFIPFCLCSLVRPARHPDDHAERSNRLSRIAPHRITCAKQHALPVLPDDEPAFPPSWSQNQSYLT